MSQFVERSDVEGLINLDFVRKLLWHKKGYQCFSADGEELGWIDDDAVIQGTIVANLYPTMVVVECWEGEGGDICLDEVPILGWILSPSRFTEAVPLTPEGSFGDVHGHPWLLRYPDGRFVKPEDFATQKGASEGESVEAVKTWAREWFAHDHERIRKAADAYAAKQAQVVVRQGVS